MTTATTLPNTTHVREVAEAMSAAGFTLAFDGLSDWASKSRMFTQRWEREGEWRREEVRVDFSERGYVHGFSTGRAYATTHKEGRHLGVWRPHFGPRQCLDLLVKDARTDGWIFS